MDVYGIYSKFMLKILRDGKPFVWNRYSNTDSVPQTTTVKTVTDQLMCLICYAEIDGRVFSVFTTISTAIPMSSGEINLFFLE